MLKPAVPTHFVECVQMAACVKIIFPELMQEVVNCAVKNDACRRNASVDITRNEENQMDREVI